MQESVVPQSYDELFENYFAYVRYLVVAAGVAYQDVEDVVSEILIKFMEPWRTCKACGARYTERAWLRQKHLRYAVASCRYYLVEAPAFTTKGVRCPAKVKDKAGEYLRLRGWTCRDVHIVKRCGGALTPPNNGFLSQYRPERGRFQTLLSDFVKKYVRQDIDRLRKISREQVPLDETTVPEVAISVEVFMDPPEFVVFMEHIQRHLDPDLIPLFLACHELDEHGEKVTPVTLARELDIPLGKARTDLVRLRTQVEALGLVAA